MVRKKWQHLLSWTAQDFDEEKVIHSFVKVIHSYFI